MTVLYDAGCRLCRSAQRWLSSRRQLVPLEFVAAGSPGPAALSAAGPGGNAA